MQEISCLADGAWDAEEPQCSKFITVKHQISASSKFRGLKKMTYWRMLILAVLIYHGSG